VPHFEKMLYDQAQLAVSYLEAYQITGEERFAEVARGIFRYVLRDLRDESGAFFSAEDADSPDPENPGHAGEGAFYIWRKAEIEALLGDEAAGFCVKFGVAPDGNVDQDPQGEFTGRNILYVALEGGDVFAGAKDKLFEARSKRPRPHLDRKILTSWNGLMISALAKGWVVLGEEKYLRAAKRSAAFFLEAMYDASGGRLMRRFCEGEAAVEGFLDDYAMLGAALLDLFEASFEPVYLERAVGLARRGRELFEDREMGGFFSTSEQAPDLLLRMKDDYDGAEPSGNSAMTELLLRLAQWTGEDEFRASAERSIRAFAPKIRAQPTIAPQMSVAMGRWLAEPEQVVIRCAAMDGEAAEIVAGYRRKFAPHSVVLAVTDEARAKLSETAPFPGGLERKGRITIYECKDFVCKLPRVIE
jgi:uncharacterized protein